MDILLRFFEEVAQPTQTIATKRIKIVVFIISKVIRMAVLSQVCFVRQADL